MTVTIVCVALGLAGVACAAAFHVGWMMWVFAAAVLIGFGSHGWLMLGVLRDKAAP